MSIDRLNEAAWAAGFAMAPTEVDMIDPPRPADADHQATVAPSASGWRSGKVITRVQAAMPAIGMRQWLTSWQGRAPA
jgi:hypothetical protein